MLSDRITSGRSGDSPRCTNACAMARTVEHLRVGDANPIASAGHLGVAARHQCAIGHERGPVFEPVGQALRVLSQESRDMRMNEAEKKAAGLPPKLTVPMILFFLPVLFVVIITPAVIQIMRTQ